MSSRCHHADNVITTGRQLVGDNVGDDGGDDDDEALSRSPDRADNTDDVGRMST